jgi:glutathione S-transferase
MISTRRLARRCARPSLRRCSGTIRTSRCRTLRPLLRIFPAYYRLRHRISEANLEKDRAVVAAALDRIEQERQDRTYLIGDAFTVADLSAAALLGVLLQPPEMQYPLQVELPPYLQDYRATLLRHPAAQWAAGIYRLHRGHSAEVPKGMFAA